MLRNLRISLLLVLMTAGCLPFVDYEVLDGNSNKISFSQLGKQDIGWSQVTLVTTSINTYGQAISDYGHCYGTSPGPTVENGDTTSNGPNTGGFVSIVTDRLSGLQHSTTYYARAYVLVSGVAVYGQEGSFSTNQTGTPTISTAGISAYTDTSVIAGGEITQIMGDLVVERGLCWSTSENPTILDNRTVRSGALGSFTDTISSLQPGTTYYIRAYATNEGGITGYGNNQNITTRNVPQVATAQVSNITAETATSGGEVVDDGDYAVTSRGVVLGTSPYPTLEDNLDYTTDGSGTGAFISNLSNMDRATDYYVRAYAVNQAGTGYGEVRAFITESGIPKVTTTNLDQDGPGAIKGIGRLDDDGGFSITERGLCWNTTGLPTKDDNFTVYSGSSAIFTLTVDEGININTTYYARAYARNKYGIGYGEVLSVTITCNYPVTGAGVTDNDGNFYQTVIVCGQEWMAENLKTTTYWNNVTITDGTGLDVSGVPLSKYRFIYADAAANKDDYGHLYNWAAVMNSSSGSDDDPSGVQGVCPTGWHVPSEAEWNQLISNLGGSSAAAGELKAAGTTYWLPPNTGADNNSGLEVLPGGMRLGNGTYLFEGEQATFWTTSDNGDGAYYIMLQFDSEGTSRIFGDKTNAHSVRCVKNPN